ncbi:hypothetical protein [Methylobacterium sp. Leaf108]|uniref:hypothetical protein n=1 Tax=Methylobacterium sp. Leaf108 TaxID=1736256 RepID=UPI000A6813C0|nr:hypothetical protein [Methylobacterium sp. Leaf108]
MDSGNFERNSILSLQIALRSVINHLRATDAEAFEKVHEHAVQECYALTPDNSALQADILAKVEIYFKFQK